MSFNLPLEVDIIKSCIIFIVSQPLYSTHSLN